MGKIVAANWKMNLRRESARALAAALAAQGRRCWLFPAHVLLPVTAQAVQGSSLKLGAQDLSPNEDGAFTGDVSGEMLADAGCELVLVGHSERRHGHGEDDALLLRKLQRAMAAGLKPLLCVGETAAQRSAGQAREVVAGQLIVLEKLETARRRGLCAVAYEPVWAIGTGANATAAQVQEMHRHARAVLETLRLGALPVLYGGSVNPANAGELLACPAVDGLLVGGAGLKLDSLSAIDDAALKA